MKIEIHQLAKYAGGVKAIYGVTLDGETDVRSTSVVQQASISIDGESFCSRAPNSAKDAERINTAITKLKERQ